MGTWVGAGQGTVPLGPHFLPMQTTKGDTSSGIHPEEPVFLPLSNLPFVDKLLELFLPTQDSYL